MHPAVAFALDLAEAALEDAEKATAHLPPTALAVAAAARTRGVLGRLRIPPIVITPIAP